MRAGRVLAAVFAAAMLMTACGEAEPTAEEAPDSTAPAAEGEAVRVGVVLPEAGVYAQLGPDILDGMRLYLEEVNNQAGGRPIELIVEDETADANTALDRTRRLIDQDVDMLTGYVSTAAVYAARDLIDERQIPTIVSNAGGNDLTRSRRSDYIFRSSFTSDQVSFPLGTWVAENIGDRAVILASDYAFGQESAAAFRASFEAAGGTVVDEIFTPLGSTDFSGYIGEIGAADADATFGFLAGSDGVIFVQQYAQAGLMESKPLTVAGFVVESDVLDAVGEAALGAISSLHWAPTLDNPENQAFTEAYQAAYDRAPSVYAMQGYDTGRVIVEALEATGGETEPAALVEAISGVSFASPRGEFRFDPETNQVIQHIYVREVEQVDGQLTNQVIEDLGEVQDPPGGAQAPASEPGAPATEAPPAASEVQTPAN